MLGLAPPPLQLRLAATKHSNRRPTTLLHLRRLPGRQNTSHPFLRRACIPPSITSVNPKAAAAHHPGPLNFGKLVLEAGIVTVTVAGLAEPAVIDVGLTAHVVPLSVEATVHEKSTVLLKPLTAVILTVELPD